MGGRRFAAPSHSPYFGSTTDFLMIQSPSASCTRPAEGLSDAAVILFSRFSIFCSQIPLKYAILDAEGGERMERLIFHVDVNSAFLSWEAARRVAAGEADLRLIPSAIGGDRDKRTGIILAKSIPAKKFGVTTGEPVGMALRKCPPAVCWLRRISGCTRKTPERSSPSAAAMRPSWSRCPLTNAFWT